MTRFILSHPEARRRAIASVSEAPKKNAPLCKFCGGEIVRKGHASWPEFYTRKFCSRSCSSYWQSNKIKEKTVNQVYGQNYSINKENGCWEWTGSLERYGYGCLSHAGNYYRAHRHMLDMCGLELGEDGWALHRCDNQRCVNPFHLYIGGPKENSNDAKMRGRLPRGSKQHLAVLTEEQVRTMRIRYESGEKIYQISSESDVAYQTCWSAIKRKSWKHVTD